MFQRAVLRNSKPDSFTMLPGTVENPAQFKSSQERFISSVSDWTHFLDIYLPAERVHFSTPIPPPIYLSLLDTSSTFHLPPITPPAVLTQTPHALSPLQCGEYCQGAIEVLVPGILLVPHTLPPIFEFKFL